MITAGSRGLGLLLARQFGRTGARVALCARDHDGPERASADLRGRGVPVVTMGCDITDRNRVDQLVGSVEPQWGPIDVLVNNAGVIQVGLTEEMTIEEFEESMGVHFWGPLYVSLASTNAMTS